MNVAFDQVARAFKVRRQTRREAGTEVRLAVMVGCGADRGLTLGVRAALRPRNATGRLYIAGYGADKGMPPVNGLSDAAIVVVAPGELACAAELYQAYRSASIPCCVVASPSYGRGVASDLARRGVAVGDLLVVDGCAVGEALGSWLVRCLPDLAAALGASFACCRRARARAAVGAAVKSNAALGALTVLDGADLPAMLAAELAMLLKIADTYGLEPGVARAGEAAVVAAAAFGLRGASRALVAGVSLPAPFIKAAVAAAGTYAVGRALMAYYEARSPLEEPCCRPAEVLSVECAPFDDGVPYEAYEEAGAR